MDEVKKICNQRIINAKKTLDECVYGLDDEIINIANGRTVDNKSFCYGNRYRSYKARS